MRFLVASSQVPELDTEQQARLYTEMQRFYAGIPANVVLECDYIRADRLGLYSVLTVPDRPTLDEILRPFEGLVEVEVVALADPEAVPSR